MVVFSAFFLACKTSKNISENQFQKKAPFKIEQATYQNWVGGQPGIKGVIVQIKLRSSQVALDSIYFRNMKVALESVKNTSDSIYIGHFQYPNTNIKHIYHEDSRKEYGNVVPDISRKIPFELQKDEAIVSYHFNEKVFYYKIEELKEIKSSY